MQTVRVLLNDTKEIREIKIPETEIPTQYMRAARRDIGSVPRRLKSVILGYTVPQPEFTPPEHDYVAIRG